MIENSNFNVTKNFSKNFSNLFSMSSWIHLQIYFSFTRNNFKNASKARLVVSDSGAELNRFMWNTLRTFLALELVSTENYFLSARVRVRFDWATFNNEMISFVLEPFVLVLARFSTCSFLHVEFLLCWLMLYALISSPTHSSRFVSVSPTTFVAEATGEYQVEAEAVHEDGSKMWYRKTRAGVRRANG